MKVKDIDYRVSVKLGDPVTDNGNGEAFTQEERLGLIRDAYSKLSRFLRILMRDYQPEFNNQRKYDVINEEPPSGQPHTNIFNVPAYRETNEVFAVGKYVENNKSKSFVQQCTFKDSDKYLSIKNGINDIASPDWEKLQIYYFLMGDKLYLLPEPDSNNYYTSIELLYLPDAVILEMDTEIPMTQEYIDMLIELAAMKGMQDIARIDKVRLYADSVYEDFKILGQYATLMKQQEGIKE